MRKLIITSIAILPAFFSASFVGAQEENIDTLQTSEDTTQAVESDPVRAQISAIIKEVNKRSKEVDNIYSEGDITVKTPKIDESGSLTVKVKKKDDVWFIIEGPLGIDAAEGYFARKKFTFLDHLNKQAVTGSTTILNIGQLTKIRCTFDDLLNSFSGTVRISFGKKDSAWMSEEGNQYVVSLKRGSITRKYWIDKDYYNVYKYLYLNKKGVTLIQLEFSSFSYYGNSAYAKRVEIRRPKQREYFKLEFETISLNQNGLTFSIFVPSDYMRKVWK